MTVSEKFKANLKNAKLSSHEKAVQAAVEKALADFCGQNAEFEQAVLQGGSFADCLKACVKGVKGSISDLEVYRRAVEFYFPTAEVRMAMTLDLGDSGFSGETEDKPITMSSKVELSLDDLLDF